MTSPIFTLEFSWRYCVVGLYRDRSTIRTSKGPRAIWRFYPVPFVRVTIDRSGG